MKNEHCRSCQAPIFWILTPDGKKAPVDSAESTEGKGWKATDAGWKLAVGTPEEPVHRSHFATCPEGQRWKGSSR